MILKGYKSGLSNIENRLLVCNSKILEPDILISGCSILIIMAAEEGAEEEANEIDQFLPGLQH